jgi:hypothetical protein
MTRKQKEKLIVDIKEHLKENGWKEDRYGNFLKDGLNYRMKFNKTTLRLEYKNQSKTWIRVSSGYYKDLSIVGTKIHGMTR